MSQGKQIIIYGSAALVLSLLLGRIGLAFISLAAVIVGVVILVNN